MTGSERASVFCTACLFFLFTGPAVEAQPPFPVPVGPQSCIWGKVDCSCKPVGNPCTDPHSVCDTSRNICVCDFGFRKNAKGKCRRFREDNECQEVDCGVNGIISEADCRNATEHQVLCGENCLLHESAERQYVCMQMCYEMCINKTCEECCPLDALNCPVIECGGTVGTISETKCRNATINEAVCVDACMDLSADKQFACMMDCKDTCLNTTCPICCPFEPFNCPTVDCGGEQIIPESLCLNATLHQAECIAYCFGKPAEQQGPCLDMCREACLSESCAACCPALPESCTTVNCTGKVISLSDCKAAEDREAACFGVCATKPPSEQWQCMEDCHWTCLNQSCPECCPLTPTSCPTVDCAGTVGVIPATVCEEATDREAMCFNECFKKPAEQQEDCTEACKEQCLNNTCAACCPLNPTHCPTVDCASPNGIISESTCRNATQQQALCFDMCFMLSADKQANCTIRCTEECLAGTCAECCPLTPTNCPTVDCGEPKGQIAETVCIEAMRKEAECFNMCEGKPADQQLECTTYCQSVCLNTTCAACCPLQPAHCPVVDCGGEIGEIPETLCLNASLEQARCVQCCSELSADKQEGCLADCRSACLNSSCEVCCPSLPSICPTVNCSGNVISEVLCHNATLNEELCFSNCFLLSAEEQEWCTQACHEECLNSTCDLCCLLTPTHCPVVDCTSNNNGHISESTCHSATVAQSDCFDNCLATQDPVDQHNCTQQCLDTCLNTTCAQCCPLEPTNCPTRCGGRISEAKCIEAGASQAMCSLMCMILSPPTQQSSCMQVCLDQCLMDACEDCCPNIPFPCGFILCNDDGSEAVTFEQCKDATQALIDCHASCEVEDFANQYSCQQNCISQCEANLPFLSCTDNCCTVPPQEYRVDCTDRYPNRYPTYTECQTANEIEQRGYNACITAYGSDLEQVYLCQLGVQENCLDATCSACCKQPPIALPKVDCGAGRNILVLHCQRAEQAENYCFCKCSTSATPYGCQQRCHQDCLEDACAACCPNLPTGACPGSNPTVLDSDCDLARRTEIACVDNCDVKGGTAAQIALCKYGCYVACRQPTCDACCPACIPSKMSCNQTITVSMCYNAYNNYVNCRNQGTSDSICMNACMQAVDGCHPDCCYLPATTPKPAAPPAITWQPFTAGWG